MTDLGENGDGEVALGGFKNPNREKRKREVQGED